MKPSPAAAKRQEAALRRLKKSLRAEAEACRLTAFVVRRYDAALARRLMDLALKLEGASK